MDERDVVDMLRHVRQHVLILLPALPRGCEGHGTSHQVAVLALKRHHLFLARQRLAIVLFQRRLVLPQVDVRRAAGAEDLQNALRLRRELRAAGLARSAFARCATQIPAAMRLRNPIRQTVTTFERKARRVACFRERSQIDMDAIRWH